MWGRGALGYGLGQGCPSWKVWLGRWCSSWLFMVWGGSALVGNYDVEWGGGALGLGLKDLMECYSLVP